MSYNIFQSDLWKPVKKPIYCDFFWKKWNVEGHADQTKHHRNVIYFAKSLSFPCSLYSFN